MTKNDLDVGDVQADDLSPSCRCVIQALLYYGPELSRQELLKSTGLPERTLYDALETCEYRGFIVRARKSGDAREIVAKLSIN
jgi:DNA-binding MarR family transcriptional regulator